MDRRIFVAGLGGATAGGMMGEAFAAQTLTATATRLDAQRVKLTWAAPAGARANVLVSSDPIAAKPAMRALQTRVVASEAIVSAPASPRPYFLVSTGLGRDVRVAERLLPLQGGRNFRDMGGYSGSEGRVVKWGRLYRSGVMSSLTPPDVAYLRELGVSVVCDLRSAAERTSEPSVLIGNQHVKILAADYELASSLSRMMTATNRAQAVEVFADTYVNFMTMLKPQYTDMFANLLDNQGSFALNCTAGKDRTGVGSALILSVLGVDRATIIADYALSQVYVPPSYYLGLARTAGANAPAGGTAAQVSPLSQLPPEVAAIILGSDREVMRQFLARVDREMGGPIGVAKARFGLTDVSIRQLRRKYLA
jgi:protein-tyrosine phosphatase